MPSPSFLDRMRLAAQQAAKKLYSDQELDRDGNVAVQDNEGNPVDPITPRIERGVLGYNQVDYSPPKKVDGEKHIALIRKAVENVTSKNPAVVYVQKNYPGHLGGEEQPVDMGDLDDKDVELQKLKEQREELERILEESKRRQRGPGLELERAVKK